MTKRRTFATPTQVRAQAALLDGHTSRAAAASATSAADTAADVAEPGGGNPGRTSGELWLYGAVGGWWFGFDAESVADALRGMDVDDLTVRLHSPGGRATEGVAIGNLLRNHRANVTVVVDGVAASAASVIAVAGDEVVMCPGSQMMIHDVSLLSVGNAAQLRRDSEWCDGQSDNYAGVYAHRAGGTVAEWRAQMTANDGEGTWFTAQAAVDAGLADEVGTRTAAGSAPVAPADDLDDEDALARVMHDVALIEECVPPAVAAAWRGERRPKPPTASAGGHTPTEGGSAVAFSDEQLTTLRQKLGVAETADEATILAALDEALEERSETTAETTTVPSGHVVIPAAQLETLRAGATAGAAAARTLHERDREAFLDANRAKYPSQLREAWAKQYDLDPKAAAEALAASPDLIPVGEQGHAVDTDAAATAAAEIDAVRQSDVYKNWSM